MAQDDLKSMVAYLVDSAGMTESEIAHSCQTTQPTIHRIKKGSVEDPRYKVGKSIESLYLEKTRSEQVSA